MALVQAGVSPVRVDFAHTLRDHLIVYGWIWGLGARITSAEIRYGNVTFDLMSFAVPVPRPDVTQHFASQTDGMGDHHGFYLCVGLPGASVRPGYLRMAVTNFQSETEESVWPVTSGDTAAISLAQQHGATIDWLIHNLSTSEADELRLMLLPDSGPAKSESPPGLLGLDLAVRMEVCCILEERVLVLLGWFDARDAPLTAVTATVGRTVLDCLIAMTFARREGAATKSLRGDGLKFGFSWIGVIPSSESTVVDATIEFRAGARYGQVHRTLKPDARHELDLALKTLDPDDALDVLERAAVLLKGSADGVAPAWLTAAQTTAAERLPLAWENHNPQVLLHCDAVVPIADKGLYITGWLYAEEGAVRSVACCSGTQCLRLDDRWIRLARHDVTVHLAAQGVPEPAAEHAFLCYVTPVDFGVLYLSVILTSGLTRRIRLPAFAASAHALHAVRAVLTSFSPSHRELRTLLDEQVGPAVATAWIRRRRANISTIVKRFGPVATDPAVSVIVPLFGRTDLADYQMATFADDPDFQSLELIYFVDDPSIYDAFRAQCQDLYEIYRVPFTVAFARVNLGFAGANNCAAKFAAGRHLLLLNSDVLPKGPGWVSDMLTLYATLQSPGVLGVKLLYEDGSVQHAGISFRPHAPWGDLWINDHPHKGQSALGLHGLREVDAVTAACALVDADLYRELGGLSEDYIIGDFEDSDFCLRATVAGRRNWVALDIELYHLERQSQARIGDSQWRTNLTLFNCWQHHQRWGAHLEKHAR